VLGCAKHLSPLLLHAEKAPPLFTEQRGRGVLGSAYAQRAGHVERGDVPGIVKLVSRRGGITANTVWRISSQEKNRPRKE
jgi:hypothetical protein